MERWLQGVLIFASAGALLALAVTAWAWLAARRPPPGLGLDVLVLARDREEAVEGLLRGLLRLQRAGGLVRSVWAADAGSSDGTGSILERLAVPPVPGAAPGLRGGAGVGWSAAAMVDWLWSRCGSRPVLLLCLGRGADARELYRTVAAVAGTAAGAAAGGQ